MATFRYYKYQPMATPRQWAVGCTLISIGAYIAVKWQLMEDRSIMGAMYDNSYLYQGFHKAQASYPPKETFKRIE